MGLQEIVSHLHKNAQQIERFRPPMIKRNGFSCMLDRGVEMSVGGTALSQLNMRGVINRIRC
jgi:hypothetical protein